MAVTLYRQVGKAKAGATSRSIWVRGAALPISPVPISCGTRSLTVPVRGSALATDSTRRSPPATANRHTSKLSTAIVRSFRTKTKPVGRKSRTPCISGSLSFSSFRAKTSKQEREDAAGVQLPSWIFPRLHGAAESATPRPRRPQATSALRPISLRPRERSGRSDGSQRLRNLEYLLSHEGHFRCIPAFVMPKCRTPNTLTSTGRNALRTFSRSRGATSA